MSKTSKYFGVSKHVPKVGTVARINWFKKFPFQARFEVDNVLVLNKWYSTEREAAIAVDLKLIELGKEPRNILKKKLNS